MSDSQKEKFAILLRKYLDNSANALERIELAKLAKEVNQDSFLAFLEEIWESPAETDLVLEPKESEKILQSILHGKPEPKARTINLKPIMIRFAAAAAILLLITTGILSLRKNKMAGDRDIAAQYILPEDVMPGGNKALLTLPDGSQIVLDDTREGLIHEQFGIKVIKMDNGQLVYERPEGEPAEVAYNTISTPRGGMFNLILPDGSTVTLNANSRIRFPMIFASEKREVEIEGEVYFDVAQNKNWPFMVKINDIEIEVLGTSFNVMGYSDESAVRTTLIEGLVKVSTRTQNATLSPGQQSAIDLEGTISVIENADIADIISWKEGWFKFSRSSIEEIMRQISRWYDLDVVYEGNMPLRTYTGIVSRSSNLSKVLLMMEKAGITFRIQEETIYVTY